MIDKRLLRKRFSKNAATYDEYARVQKKMAQRLIDETKPKQRHPSASLNILEIGCGTGYLTGLLQTFPQAAITAVDFAPGMIETAQKNIGNDRVRFRCEDIEEIRLTDRYDLILSNAAFQWLNHPERTVKKLGNALKKEGILCFSTFGFRTFQELHEAFKEAKRNFNLQQAGSLGPSFFTLPAVRKLCLQTLNEKKARFEVTGYETEERETFAGVRDFFHCHQKDRCEQQ